VISLNPEERPTVSIEEAGIVLGISRWGAYQAAKTGELPTVRFGRRVRVPTAERIEAGLATFVGGWRRAARRPRP